MPNQKHRTPSHRITVRVEYLVAYLIPLKRTCSRHCHDIISDSSPLKLQNSVNSVPPRLLWGTRFSSESTRQQMSDIEKRQQMSPNRLPSSHPTLADPRYRQRQKQWQQWGWSWFYDGHVKGTAQPKTELKICMELYGYVENDKAMYTCFKIHKFCRAIRSNLLGQTPASPSNSQIAVVSKRHQNPGSPFSHVLPFLIFLKTTLKTTGPLKTLKTLKTLKRSISFGVSGDKSKRQSTNGIQGACWSQYLKMIEQCKH